MPVVAVAGGTGKLGRAIAEALVVDGSNEVIVLSRKVDKVKEKEIGARFVVTDYDSIDVLTSLLNDNNVDTIISTISGIADSGPELNLIRAADKSAATKRYIPNIWGPRYTPEMTTYFPLAAGKIETLEVIDATSLEYTSIMPGFFVDYWVASPRVKTYIDPIPQFIDVAGNAAGIPGSGEVPAVFTYTFDIAKFVAALLTLPKWEKETVIVGDVVTWNEFLRFVEEAKGVKFNVTYDSVEKLKAGQVTELPSHAAMYAYFPKEMFQKLFSAFGRMFEDGVFGPTTKHKLNDDFPDIETRKVKELVFQAWGQ